jgi:hypothetical protein
MLCALTIWLILLGELSPPGVRAADCALDAVSGAPPGIAASIAGELVDRHLVLRLDEADFCELWVAKAWKRRAENQDTSSLTSVLYPLEAGSLIGAIRLARTCYDLRDQEIPAGVYTLRYAVQPDIEAHQESHESRDFLLLVAANSDKSPEPIADQDKLIGMSAESIGCLHPAFLPLLKVASPGVNQSVRRDERDPDGWVLEIHGKDDAGKSMPMELILLRAKLGD